MCILCESAVGGLGYTIPNWVHPKHIPASHDRQPLSEDVPTPYVVDVPAGQSLEMFRLGTGGHHKNETFRI